MVRWLSLVLLCLYVHGTVIATSEWGRDSSLDSDDDPLLDRHRSESESYGVPSPDAHQFSDTMSIEPHDMEALEMARKVKETFQRIKEVWQDLFNVPPTYSDAYFYTLPSSPESFDIDDPKRILLTYSYARYYGDLDDFQSTYRNLLEWSENYDTDAQELLNDVLQSDSDGEETMDWFIRTLIERTDQLKEQRDDLRLKETPVHLDEPI
ncbi:hypothetical protein IWQ62_006592 [Dispira parvispora]|uniref:Uncharacterized protein n=1 Tax=Dispira parvispora TaxID=1520584 RepID=A0A9W8E3L9_9FUNG|nr:hypothetical protein IWQ62_006592 [Dispira parvispora]